MCEAGESAVDLHMIGGDQLLNRALSRSFATISQAARFGGPVLLGG